MKEIRNVAKKPLRVPLPQKRTLHLAPNQVGQVPPSALEHPPFQKLVEAKEIEVIGEGHIEKPHPIKVRGAATHGSQGHKSDTGHSTGDR